MLILLAGLAAAGFGIFRSLVTAGERVTLRYILEVDSIDSELVEMVQVNNGIYDYKTSHPIGTVRAVSPAPAYYEGTNSQGEIVSTAIDGKKVLYITAEAEAIKTGTGYAVGETIINVGRSLELRLPKLYCVGECVSIEVIKE